MNAFIDELMGKMTLEEKLGQLNLPASDDIVTGEAKTRISASAWPKARSAVCST